MISPASEAMRLWHRNDDAPYIDALRAEVNLLLDNNDSLLDQYAMIARQLREEIGRRERAEWWLRARLIELTWPACLCSLAGGFAAVFVIKWVTG
jgi:hypothetical protein